MGAGGLDDPMKRNGMQPTPSLAGRSRGKTVFAHYVRGAEQRKRHGGVRVSSGDWKFYQVRGTFFVYGLVSCSSSRVNLVLQQLNYTPPPTSPSYVWEPAVYLIAPVSPKQHRAPRSPKKKHRHRRGVQRGWKTCRHCGGTYTREHHKVTCVKYGLV